MHKQFQVRTQQFVSIATSGEIGEIIGRAEYTSSENAHPVRYCSADGRAVKNWWGESALN
ncbi:hypothetical protein LFL97_34000 [Burkholderia sp. JSH-S8]|nr:hypothetical protein LFL97_34000 [Burkholderia sp. JSH-S8]